MAFRTRSAVLTGWTGSFGVAILTGVAMVGALVGHPNASFGAARTTKTRATRATSSRPAPTTRLPSPWRVLSVPANGLREVSGCAVSRREPNRVWLHNDAGDGAIVVPVDLRFGAVERAVTLTGVDVVDPEDIAATNDGDLVLADIGDNNSRRNSIQLYRFPEPAHNATSAIARRIDLRYPDGPHNAEAMVLTTDASAALVLTKELTGVSAVFRADLNAQTAQVMTYVGQVTIAGERAETPNIVTAADAVGSTLFLRSFENGYVLSSPAGGQLEDALRTAPRRFDLPPMVQGEALCASADGRTLVTASESRGAAAFALAVGPVPR